MKFFSLISLCIALAVVLGCSKAGKESDTFTYATGIRLVEVSECYEGVANRHIEVKKNGDSLLITGVLPMPCRGSLAAPYLIETHEHQATLVLREEKDGSLFTSGCDCWRNVSISIEGRVEQGDTLYVSNEGEVEGHFLVP